MTNTKRQREFDRLNKAAAIRRQATVDAVTKPLAETLSGSAMNHTIPVVRAVIGFIGAPNDETFAKLVTAAAECLATHKARNL